MVLLIKTKEEIKLFIYDLIRRILDKILNKVLIGKFLDFLMNFLIKTPPITYIPSYHKRFIVAAVVGFIIFLIVLYSIIIPFFFLAFIIVDVGLYKLPPKKLFKLTFKELWEMIKKQREINKVKYAVEIEIDREWNLGRLKALIVVTICALCKWQKIETYFFIPVILLIPFFDKYIHKKPKIDIFSCMDALLYLGAIYLFHNI